MRRFSIIILVFTLLSCVTTKSQNSFDTLGTDSFEVKDVSYGKDKDQKIDIYMPRSNKKENPVIVLVHGGAWHWGDKADYEYSIDYYISRGFTVINMNYRMGNSDVTLKDKLDDIHSVIEFVYSNREKLKASDDLTLLGGSAGGHMVLQYGFTLGYGKVDRIVSYSGPTDLSNPFYKSNNLINSISPLFGTGKPSEEELKEGSPLFSIPSEPGPAIIFIHGNADLIVDFNDSQRLHDKLIEEGWDSSLIEIPGANHAYEGTDWGWVSSIFDPWLDKQLLN